MVTRDVDLAGQVTDWAADPVGIDRHRLFGSLRQDAPLLHVPALDAWVVSRFAEVEHVLRAEDDFATLRDGPGAPPYGNSMLQWRGREHQRKGGVIGKYLRTPRAIERIDAFVQQLTEDLADGLPLDGSIVDLKARYAIWIPLLVTGEVMGIEGQSRFRDWYEDIAAGSVNSIGHPERRERALEALRDLGAFLDPLIARRREEPADDLLSALCQVEYEGELLDADQILATTAFLLTAGAGTTERGLTSLLTHLIAHPDQWDRLREDQSLVESACVEALRVHPPVHGTTRIALRDTELRGELVQEGEKVLVLLASANRDEAVFEAADEFRIDRWAHDARRQFTAAGTIMPFGAGRHYCMGSQLARVQMTRGIETLMRRVARATFAAGLQPPEEGYLLCAPADLKVRLEPRGPLTSSGRGGRRA